VTLADMVANHCNPRSLRLRGRAIGGRHTSTPPFRPCRLRPTLLLEAVEDAHLQWIRNDTSLPLLYGTYNSVKCYMNTPAHSLGGGT
jgi:hypothetical protein